MRWNLAACFAETVLRWEGGARYTNDPHDPGGPTKYGVTLKTLSHELGRQATPDDVRYLTENAARDIFKKTYWNAIGADNLPSGVDMMAVDIAYNSGPGFVLQWLKETATMPPVSQIEALHGYRMAFWHRLKIWVYYGKGWTNRESDVLTKALALASGVSP